jgi:hypothetical protein
MKSIAIIFVVLFLSGCGRDSSRELIINKIKSDCQGKISMAYSVSNYSDTLTFTCDDIKIK